MWIELFGIISTDCVKIAAVHPKNTMERVDAAKFGSCCSPVICFVVFTAF